MTTVPKQASHKQQYERGRNSYVSSWVHHDTDLLSSLNRDGFSHHGSTFADTRQSVSRWLRRGVNWFSGWSGE